MIKGTFKRDEAGSIVSFTLTGHAGAGEYGEDIVCSAVSALSISAVNGIEALTGFEPILDVDTKNGGYLYVEVIEDITQEQKNISQILLENLLLGLQGIKEKYDDFIEIRTLTK